MNSMHHSGLPGAAKSYAGKGWRVIPLHDVHTGKCSCGKPPGGCKPGKHPRINEWQKKATTDTGVIEGWWKKWPHANIGIVCGKESGIFVVGPDGDEGIHDLAVLEEEYGEMPATVISATPGEGRHYLLSWADDGAPIGNSANIHGKKIDIRGEGGYFVAPPSVSDKGSYEWINPPGEYTVDEAPEWLLKWIRDGQSKDRTTTTSKPLESDRPGGARAR